MNVAIIGCGYVGTALARYWRQEGSITVLATTTTPSRVPELSDVAQRVEVLKANDVARLQSVLQEQDTVVLSVAPKSLDVYEETYLHSAQAVVSALKQNSSVRQLIYTGSYSVYGDRNGQLVDESSPVEPANPNGEILARTESVLLSASTDNRKVCILRLGGIYGPGRELAKIFSRWVGTTRPGNGSDVTNWIHLDDIVAAIEFVRANQLQGIYNLVDDAHLTSRELLDKVCSQHNLPSVLWDESLKSTRPYNALVWNQKIKDAGYQLIHPAMSA